MGLFASRPEEPDEWAGIPSEPLTADNAADLLRDSPAIDAVGLVDGSSLTSVTIPVAAPPPAP